MNTTERMPWDGKDKHTFLAANTFINFNPTEKRGLLMIHQDSTGGWEAVINDIVLPTNKEAFSKSVFYYQWNEDEQKYNFFTNSLKEINVPVSL